MNEPAFTTLVVEAPQNLLGREPVSWAVEQLRSRALPMGLRVTSRRVGDPGEAGELVVELRHEPAVGGPGDGESFGFASTVGSGAGRRITLTGSDDRGLVYGLTELAERVASSGVMGIIQTAEEHHAPVVPVRGICRPFSSVHHDLPWFRDRRFWPEYLDHLAMQRFNRFHLAFGMQHNYGPGFTGVQRVNDNYLCFAYPFLLDVPGHSVRVQGLDDTERNRNLAALAFIAAETRRRGMSFQLGLWNHAVDYGPHSQVWYPVLGLGQREHAEYCADAIARLLDAVPEIDGLTFRVHYEGGIPDNGRSEFWKGMFISIAGARRSVDVDLHAKGVDTALLDSASVLPGRVSLSAKYSAEHMGLPYHQAAIRTHEQAMPVRPGMEMMGTAEFTRRFTRYGYADFLSEDRAVDVMFRIWPGTQRVLLWGDPMLAAGFGRLCTIAGARGVELCEPLSFKGRKGSGVADGRDPYIDDELRLGLADWMKYRYTYLLFGRLLYEPDADPETWRRFLRAEFGAAALDVEAAVGALSRILPLVTMAHMPSPSNNSYWPEVYTDMPISAWLQAPPYWYDTPQPPNWGHASPLDPTMFYGIDEFVGAALVGSLDGRYGPLEVAAWLDHLVDTGEGAWARAQEALDPVGPQVRRVGIDVRVLSCLGRFFAGKFRAAVQYALFERTGDHDELSRSIDLLTGAHSAYAAISAIVDGVYQSDLAFGDRPTERGTWSDRLPAMAEDLRLLRAELDRARSSAGTGIVPSVRIALPESRPTYPDARLMAPPAFDRGAPFDVRLSVADASAVSRAVLRYRPVDQSAQYHEVPMQRMGDDFVATVPAKHTTAAFPLLCFAEVRMEGQLPVLVPGLDETLANQPYLVIPSTSAPQRMGQR